MKIINLISFCISLLGKDQNTIDQMCEDFDSELSLFFAYNFEQNDLDLFNQFYPSHRMNMRDLKCMVFDAGIEQISWIIQDNSDFFIQ